jgi:ribose/xylose/arabinose/galactoside ABC-type transport system permease subunit
MSSGPQQRSVPQPGSPVTRTAAPPPPASREATRLGIYRIFGLSNTELQIVAAIVVLAAAFSLLYPRSFATTGTLMNMARVLGILLVVSIGQSFALIVGGFDISVGATMGFVSVIASLWMTGGGSVTTAIALSLVAGIVVGLVNGLIIAALDVTPFIATLGMLTFLHGFADQLGNGGTIAGLPPELAAFGRSNWGPIPSAICIAFGSLIIAWVILKRTRAGLYIFAIGGSRETARVSGIPVAGYETLAYVLCSLFAAVGGIMLTARVSVGQGGLGQGYDLLSIATAVIGGVAIGGGVGSLVGVILGVTLITILTTGLDIAGVNAFMQEMATGVVLVGAVLISKARRVRHLRLANLIGFRRRN